MNKNLKIVIFILLFIIVFLLGMLLGMQIQGKWDKAETNKSASGSAEAQIDEETGENSDNQNDASTNDPATNDTSDDSVNETAATNHVSVDRDVDYGAMDVPKPTTDDWLFTDGNKIVDADGNEVWLTGINWFGYNTGTNTFDGLWASDLNQSIQEIANHGFNVIRVPFSAELILQWSNGEYPDANFNQATNDYLVGMDSLQIFEYVIGQCRANGLKLIIDIHCAETNASGHMVNLWYTDRISTDDYLYALSWMADRYKNDDTIIAYDLKNEPHGKPNEGDGAAIWNDFRSLRTTGNTRQSVPQMLCCRRIRMYSCLWKELRSIRLISRRMAIMHRRMRMIIISTGGAETCAVSQITRLTSANIRTSLYIRRTIMVRLYMNSLGFRAVIPTTA